jgi:ATP-dependent Clp protease ATP-binding subunit ClpB
VFRPLTREDLARIVDIQAARLGRLLEERRMTLRLTSELRARLAEIGYDPEYGARPLKRTIQRMVMDPLARKVLEGSLAPGDDITADWDATAGRVSFDRQVMTERTASTTAHSH